LARHVVREIELVEVILPRVLVELRERQRSRIAVRQVRRQHREREPALTPQIEARRGVQASLIAARVGLEPVGRVVRSRDEQVEAAEIPAVGSVVTP